jgi:hypothetical protein
LEDKGYVVIPDLLTPKECDTLTSQYKDWVDKFDEGHIPLQKRTSVIQSYRVGHFQQSWEVRLKAKAVFQAVWGTEKLLSSIDGIAISKPPQNGTKNQYGFISLLSFQLFSYIYMYHIHVYMYHMWIENAHTVRCQHIEIPDPKYFFE